MLLLIWLTNINGSMSIIERARAELPEGKTIAHGFLTLSLLGLLVKEAVVLESDFKTEPELRFQSGEISLASARGLANSCPLHPVEP